MKQRIINIIKSKELLVAILIIAFVYFILFPTLIFWDSGHYMSFVAIFEKNAPWSSWDVVRGPVFPLIIYLSNYIFGKTSTGLLITQGLFYLILFISTYLIFRRLASKNNKIVCAIACAISFLFLMIDPIIFGYMHSLLTEFVAIAISLLMCFLSWKWIDINYKKQRILYIIFAILFSLAIMGSYFLKQIYVSIALFPLLTAFIVSIFYDKSWKSSLCRLGVIIFSLLLLVGSIKGWNAFLKHKGVNTSTDRNVTVSFGNTLIQALGDYQLEKVVTEDNIDSFKLSKSDKKEITKNMNKYSVVSLKNGNNKIQKSYLIPSEGGNVSTINATFFIIKQTFTNFGKVFDSYMANYLAIANIYSKKTTDSITYSVNKEIDLDYCHENCAIAGKIKENQNNIAYMLDDARIRVADYEQFNNSPVCLKKMLDNNSPISQTIFKIVMVSLPFTFIASLVFFFVFKCVDKKLLSLQVIISTYSLLHYLAHVGTGMNIDRYASPVYYTGLLTIILLIITVINFVVSKKRDKKAL